MFLVEKWYTLQFLLYLLYKLPAALHAAEGS